MKSLKRAIVSFAAIATAASLAAAQEMKKEIGEGEGQVDIVAWPGYIERGETDKAYDWVTGFEKETGCKVNVKTAATSDEMVTLMNQGGFDLVTGTPPYFPAGTAEACGFTKPTLEPLHANFTSQAVTAIDERRTRYYFTWGPSTREDRAIQLLFHEMSAWAQLSDAHHALLCGLGEPHGEAFRWLEQQWHEHGILAWPELQQSLPSHPLGDWVVRVVQAAPDAVVFDQAELNSILIELEKIAVAQELNAMATQVAQDPVLFERFRHLNQRLIQLKSGQA